MYVTGLYGNIFLCLSEIRVLSQILLPEKYQAILICYSNYGDNDYSIMQNDFNVIMGRKFPMSSLLVEIKY